MTHSFPARRFSVLLSTLAPRSLPSQARQPDLRHVRASVSTGGVPPVDDVTRRLRALRIRVDCLFGPRLWLAGISPSAGGRHGSSTQVATPIFSAGERRCPRRGDSAAVAERSRRKGGRDRKRTLMNSSQ